MVADCPGALRGRHDPFRQLRQVGVGRPADAVVQVFEATGAAERAWVQVPGEPWPTVEEMLDAGAQLVVFHQDDPHAGQAIQRRHFVENPQ